MLKSGILWAHSVIILDRETSVMAEEEHMADSKQLIATETICRYKPKFHLLVIIYLWLDYIKSYLILLKVRFWRVYNLMARNIWPLLLQIIKFQRMSNTGYPRQNENIRTLFTIMKLMTSIQNFELPQSLISVSFS